jgi:hypothetical protein
VKGPAHPDIGRELHQSWSRYTIDIHRLIFVLDGNMSREASFGCQILYYGMASPNDLTLAVESPRKRVKLCPQCVSAGVLILINIGKSLQGIYDSCGRTERQAKRSVDLRDGQPFVVVGD